MALQLGVMLGDAGFITVLRYPFRIGRSSECDLCLPNSKRVSRKHADIVKCDDGYFLIASGRNPTYLNGKLVLRESPQEITDGDVIGLPDYTIRVRDRGHASADDPYVTGAVHVPTNSTMIERMVGSTLGIQGCSYNEGIHRWLQGQHGREVRIYHDRLELTLTARLEPQGIAQRLQLFDVLMVDPHAVLIDIVDPVPVDG